MSDENQIEIPPSFTALFADRSGTRLRTPISEVRQRYEACEDLATHLTETARILAHVEVPSEDEVLHRIHAGLRSDGSGVSPAEARWQAFDYPSSSGICHPSSSASRSTTQRALVAAESRQTSGAVFRIAPKSRHEALNRATLSSR